MSPTERALDPAILARREQIAENCRPNGRSSRSSSGLDLVSLAESYGRCLGHAAYDLRTGEMPKITGTHGKVIAGAHCLIEAAACVLAARAKCNADDRVIADAEISRIEKEVNKLRAALALLDAQLSDAREDRFAYQDRKQVVA